MTDCHIPAGTVLRMPKLAVKYAAIEFSAE